MFIKLNLIFLFLTFFLTKKCGKFCKICPFIYNYSFIKLNKLILPILCHSNCETEYIVYIIICIKCNVFYIGETSKSLRIRIGQHINGIKRFVPIFKPENEVADHFNLVGHVLNRDFKVCIFKDKLKELSIRRSVELDLIYLFKNVFNFEILNEKIYNINYIKSLSFV